MSKQEERQCAWCKRGIMERNKAEISLGRRIGRCTVIADACNMCGALSLNVFPVLIPRKVRV